MADEYKQREVDPQYSKNMDTIIGRVVGTKVYDYAQEAPETVWEKVAGKKEGILADLPQHPAYEDFFDECVETAEKFESNLSKKVSFSNIQKRVEDGAADISALVCVPLTGIAALTSILIFQDNETVLTMIRPAAYLALPGLCLGSYRLAKKLARRNYASAMKKNLKEHRQRFIDSRLMETG